MIVDPDQLVHKCWTESTRTVEVDTNNKFGGTADAPTLNMPVKDDWEHGLDLDDYKSQCRVFWEQAAS